MVVPVPETTDTVSTNCGCGSTSCCLFGEKRPMHSDPVFATNASVRRSLMGNDALLAKELNELSFEERERVFDDIHGVMDTLQETPEFIEDQLQQLDKALHELPRSKRPAWERALFLKPSIGRDTKFKLMFLRVDGYDAFKAARRIAKYFDDKVKVFGDDKMVQKITLADLSKEDMELFQRGPFVCLPQTDAVGRPIWLNDVKKIDFSHPGIMLRCAWYFIMAALEDEAAQIKGFCNLIYSPKGNTFSASIPHILNTMIKDFDILTNLPARPVCTHFCYDSASMEFVLSGFRRGIGRKNRLRVRTHYGSGIEIQYNLMTYGIKLPFLLEHKTADGNNENCVGRDAKAAIHQQFIQQRLQLEQDERQQQGQMYQDTINSTNHSGSSNNKNNSNNPNICSDDNPLIIPCPNPNDVLVGRGCPYQKYSGNMKLGEIIDKQFLNRYSQATDPFEKSCIHVDVVKAIQDVCGGRFLERTPEGWKVVNDRVARKKVNSSFRSKMAKYPATAPSTNTSKSTASSVEPCDERGGSAKRARYDPSVLP